MAEEKSFDGVALLSSDGDGSFLESSSFFSRANTRQAKSAVLSPEERLRYWRASMTPAERKSLTRESVRKRPSEGLIDLDDAKRLVV